MLRVESRAFTFVAVIPQVFRILHAACQTPVTRAMFRVIHAPPTPFYRIAGFIIRADQACIALVRRSRSAFLTIPVTEVVVRAFHALAAISTTTLSVCLAC